jgi:hypothetical protein
MPTERRRKTRKAGTGSPPASAGSSATSGRREMSLDIPSYRTPVLDNSRRVAYPDNGGKGLARSETDRNVMT